MAALPVACHAMVVECLAVGPCGLSTQTPPHHPVVAACCCADEVDIGRKTRKRKTPASAAGKRKTRGAMTSSRVPKSFQRLLEEVGPHLAACAEISVFALPMSKGLEQNASCIVPQQIGIYVLAGGFGGEHTQSVAQYPALCCPGQCQSACLFRQKGNVDGQRMYLNHLTP
jgi:hypothetical protein